MRAQRDFLNTPNRPTHSLVLAILALFVLSAPVLAAGGGAQATIETGQTQQGTAQIAGTPAAHADGITGMNDVEPALATPVADPAASIIYNPCYAFDDPVTGCYYKWSPATFCCIGNSRCPDICW